MEHVYQEFLGIVDKAFSLVFGDRGDALQAIPLEERHIQLPLLTEEGLETIKLTYIEALFGGSKASIVAVCNPDIAKLVYYAFTLGTLAARVFQGPGVKPVVVCLQSEEYRLPIVLRLAGVKLESILLADPLLVPSFRFSGHISELVATMFPRGIVIRVNDDKLCRLVALLASNIKSIQMCIECSGGCICGVRDLALAARDFSRKVSECPGELPKIDAASFILVSLFSLLARDHRRAVSEVRSFSRKTGLSPMEAIVVFAFKALKSILLSGL